MGHRRFRVIFKVLCNNCTNRLDVNCKMCEHKKYNNVNKPVKWAGLGGFLDTNFPSWVYCNFFEYKKGQDKGRFLRRYTKKDRPQTDNELDHL